MSIVTKKLYHLSGLSTDTKPIPEDIATGSTFLETDTGIIFIYNRGINQWIPSTEQTEPQITAPCVGILSIELTSRAGLVDTYTIRYTNGASTTFNVTNGSLVPPNVDITNPLIDNRLYTVGIRTEDYNLYGIAIFNATEVTETSVKSQIIDHTKFWPRKEEGKFALQLDINSTLIFNYIGTVAGNEVWQAFGVSDKNVLIWYTGHFEFVDGNDIANSDFYFVADKEEVSILDIKTSIETLSARTSNLEEETYALETGLEAESQRAIDAEELEINERTHEDNLIKYCPKVLTKDSDYLYEVEYDNLDYEFAEEQLKNLPIEGGCSSIWKKVDEKTTLYARNFDWTFDKSCTFNIHVKKGENRFESWGVAGGNTSITTDNVLNKYSDAYRLLPFFTLDGQNENDVVCNNNVVHYILSDGEEFKTIPTKEKELTLSMRALPRYILDHAVDARSICEYVKEHIELTCPTDLLDKTYICHFMVADKNECFILEVDADKTLKIIEGQHFLFNFEQRRLILNDDGSVYTPATMSDEADAYKTNKIDELGSGLERWNIANAYYDDIETEEDMISLIRDKLCYRLAYGCANDEESAKVANFSWYSEFTYPDVLTVDMPKAIYDSYAVPEKAVRAFNNRTREPQEEEKPWHTTHTSIYTINRKILHVYSQTHEAEEMCKVFNYDKEAIWQRGTGLNSIQLANSQDFASGDYATAGGYGTQAEANYSHTEGFITKVSSDDEHDARYGHAEGYMTYVGGLAGHAEGDTTYTQNIAEHAEGRGNKSHKDSDNFGSAGNTIHSIGIAQNNQDLTTFKNAVEVMQNGDQYILGIGDYDGKDIDGAETVQTVINTTINDLTTESQTARQAEADLGARIDNLDLAQVGQDGYYIKTISQANGQVSATTEQFQTVWSNSGVEETNNRVPSSKLVKDTIDDLASDLPYTIVDLGDIEDPLDANGFYITQAQYNEMIASTKPIMAKINCLYGNLPVTIFLTGTVKPTDALIPGNYFIDFNGVMLNEVIMFNNLEAILTDDSPLHFNGLRGSDTYADGDIVRGLEAIVDELETKLPDPPSQDGTYHLEVTIANGIITYSWVLNNN